MPVIQRFDGFVIRMYFEDHNPPHVHVVGPDFEVLVAVQDGRLIGGSIPAKFRKEAMAWMADNKDWLVEKWTELH